MADQAAGSASWQRRALLYSNWWPQWTRQLWPQAVLSKRRSAQPVLQVIIDEINYHIDDQDSWFFSGKTTLIDYDPQNGLTFHFFNGNGEPVDANTAASKGNTRFEGLWD